MEIMIVGDVMRKDVHDEQDLQHVRDVHGKSDRL
jgi:hypothetical protein